MDKCRVTAVALEGMRVVSAHQPNLGTDGEDLNEYRSALETKLAISWREILVI